MSKTTNKKSYRVNLNKDSNPAHKKSKRTIISQQLSISKHSGPLPHPDILKEYAHLIPNGADRIMKMAENQQDQRHNLENKIVDNKCKKIKEA